MEQYKFDPQRLVDGRMKIMIYKLPNGQYYIPYFEVGGDKHMHDENEIAIMEEQGIIDPDYWAIENSLWRSWKKYQFKAYQDYAIEHMKKYKKLPEEPNFQEVYKNFSEKWRKVSVMVDQNTQEKFNGNDGAMGPGSDEKLADNDGTVGSDGAGNEQSADLLQREESGEQCSGKDQEGNGVQTNGSLETGGQKEVLGGRSGNDIPNRESANPNA